MSQSIFGGHPITDRSIASGWGMALCCRLTPSPACQNRKEFCQIISRASAVQVVAHKYAIRPGSWHCNSAGPYFLQGGTLRNEDSSSRVF